MILKFKVIEQTLFPYPTNGIPRAGSRDYLQLDFDFCEGTEGYVKTVYFFAENREVEGEGVGNYSSAEVYQGEPITVDAFFAQGDFSISVGLVDGGVSYSTNEVSIPLDPASDIWLQLPPNLEIPAYQQLVQLAQSASASADQAATNAADAISAAEDALQKAEEVHDLAATAGGAASSAASAAEAAEKAAAAAAEEAEEARLLAEDAEQTAITAISMGNHIIRADTSDGVSYVAERSATLPAIAVGSGGTHKGKGTRIVFIPGGKNTVAVPTLCIDDRDIIPIRLRSAANKGDNDQAPDATDDIPVGALMAGVPYAMTFCGKYWLIDSLIGGVGGNGSNVYVQVEEPADAPDGSFWINPDEEESSTADTSGFSGSDFDIVLTRDSIKKELAVTCTGLDPAESYALHLYTVSRRKGNAQKKWQHHPNYDIDDSKMNIQRKGYGRIAETSYEYVRPDNDPSYYPPVPDWMPNKGYLQTEWPLTPDENGVGKVIINPRNWLVPLLKPDGTSDSLDDIEQFGFIGIRRNDQQSLHFRFRVIRLSDGAMSRLSEQTFSAGSPHIGAVTLVDTDSADTVAIAKEKLHTSISVS